MTARNRYYRGAVSDHFDGTRFFVPGARGATDKSVGDLLRFVATSSSRWPSRISNPVPAPVVERVEAPLLRLTSLGHATHLVQVGGLNILIDPVWSRRAGPFGLAGPKRVRDPGLSLEALPPIDVVLLTHNHYDHLDLATLVRLRRRGLKRIVVPLGNDTILRRRDPELVAEAYDWDHRVRLSPSVEATLLPSLHWSARGMRDRRMALWCAYLIEAPGGSIYHVGDTAHGDGSLFRAVRERFGAPRLAVLPIGAYEPRWFMRTQHVDPDEAVSILCDLEARHAMAHHWGTFKLTAEAIDDPPRRLAAALLKAGIDAARFRVQLPGQAWNVPP